MLIEILNGLFYDDNRKKCYIWAKYLEDDSMSVQFFTRIFLTSNILKCKNAKDQKLQCVLRTVDVLLSIENRYQRTFTIGWDMFVIISLKWQVFSSELSCSITKSQNNEDYINMVLFTQSNHSMQTFTEVNHIWHI